MLFFFPDSQDQIDPRWDFDREEHLPFHVRQRDDLYAHEVHDAPPYNGMLVSKTIVDGQGGAGRYTSAQRHRFYRLGVHEFFRLPAGMLALGDCGAFTYHREPKPPYSVEEVVDFYGCGFDWGISLDHVILDYKPELDAEGAEPEERLVERQVMTLRYAEDFLAERERRALSFEPLGVAQGWSPGSFALAVEELFKLGYRRIALGGMVPLKDEQILDCLAAIDELELPDAQFHLLGVTRTHRLHAFDGFGVTSFDSTSPFRQAFKDENDNFYGPGPRNYTALRVPQVDGNTKLKARIQAGQVDQGEARGLERRCLEALVAYDAGDGTLMDALNALLAYDQLIGAKRDNTEAYRRTLEDRPWQKCPCAVCRDAGIQVAIFRGTERNKRRGFHNVFVFNQKLQHNLDALNRTTERTTR